MWLSKGTCIHLDICLFVQTHISSLPDDITTVGECNIGAMNVPWFRLYLGLWQITLHHGTCDTQSNITQPDSRPYEIKNCTFTYSFISIYVLPNLRFPIRHRADCSQVNTYAPAPWYCCELVLCVDRFWWLTNIRFIVSSYLSVSAPASLRRDFLSFWLSKLSQALWPKGTDTLGTGA